MTPPPPPTKLPPPPPTKINFSDTPPSKDFSEIFDPSSPTSWRGEGRGGVDALFMLTKGQLVLTKEWFTHTENL